jgi:hypothetical protein
LQHYLRFFSPTNFYIIRYEDIQQAPQKVLRNIFSFLDVNADFTPVNLKTKPKKNSNNKFLMKLESKFTKNKILIRLADKLHQVLPDGRTYSKSEKEIRALLQNFYESHKEFVNIDFVSSELLLV